ncbi:MAG: bifunctional uridylyltransferase/uridylyl-removing protein GlnD [Aeromonadaceae bacterium]
MLASEPSAIELPTGPIEIANGKECLCQFQEWLRSRFLAGDSVVELVASRSHFIDGLLSRLWEQFGLAAHPHLALIAVGGYGRGELHPHSDIDILILSRQPLAAALGETIGQFLTLLWDLRLEVGHSVRTIHECVEQGKHDLTIATNLMESRLITGALETYAALNQAIQPDHFWPSEQFFQAKRDEQETRHQQYKETAYLLEPDLKSNPGGMRDIQTLAWVARRQFGATSLYEMTSYGFLSRSEYLELLDCQNLLWRLRFALHIVIGKNDNRMLFDRQRAVAEILGYPGQGNAPVEQMMKRFYQTVRRVAELNEMLLQLFDEAILGNAARSEVRLLDEQFLLRGTHIDTRDPELFSRDPKSILALFYQIAEHPEINGIYSACLRQLREARRRLIVSLQELPECRKLFMQILRHPRGIGLPLTLMHEHAILAAYFPQWSQIVGQMQFDMFHAYTVDEHTHRLLKNIYRFMRPTNEKEQPLFREVYSRLAKPELLFLAALFHDIAKGRGGDHSELGAGEALYFCQLHGLDRYESRLVAWLVRSHLLFSVTAQRRDIYDPDVVNDFAEKVRDEQHLDYLYCLTVADICATNDNLWNDWKGTLLRELYFASQKALRLGLENPPDLRLRIRENQRQALELLTHQGIAESAITTLWQEFKADYFLRHSPEQIAWHTQHILPHDRSEPLVLFGQHAARGGSELFLYCRDMPNLFATVAAILDHKNLNIHDAQIMSSKDGYVMDTFVVLEPNGDPVDPERIPFLRKGLTNALNNPAMPLPKPKALSRRHRQFNVPTRVNYLPNKGDKKHTLIELITLDRPGLLARIGAVLLHCKFSVHSAKITTIGERAEDFFSLSRPDGELLTEEDEKLLREKLVAELNPIDDM